MATIRLGLGQINSVVGDMGSNAALISDVMARCDEQQVDLVIFPELSLNGYPPEDLVYRDDFLQQTDDGLAALAQNAGECASVVGFVDHFEDLRFNAAAVLHQGVNVSRSYKRELPNYGVFDEQRVFTSGKLPLELLEIGGVRVGVLICEDAWATDGIAQEHARGGAELLVVINASPFFTGRWKDRLTTMVQRARETKCAIAYVNAVGGQDELVFDGGSFVISAEGEVVAELPQFEESIGIFDLAIGNRTGLHSVGFSTLQLSAETRATNRLFPPAAPRMTEDEETYQALVLGLGDYARKNGFNDVVLGLSGGIDSAVVAAIAVDALGAQHVHGVLMPSRFTSQQSTDDAQQLADVLGISTQTISIEQAHQQLLDDLRQGFGETEKPIVAENIQSRIRGAFLMALSNQFGWLVISTGNKSELAVGYSTLYGDTVGGFAVLKDVLKTRVYDLALLRNARPDAPIPNSTLTKAPSAELREHQKDEDSLPPYDLLDQIVAGYVEQDQSAEALVARGFSEPVVRHVISLVHGAEYKRRQLPPGVRITPRAFGKDRRWPITNRFSPSP